jgi:hypothetical protein
LTGVYPDRMEARSEGQSAKIRLIFSECTARLKAQQSCRY